MQATGHTPAHAVQSIHASSSINLLPSSTSEMQDTGHTSSHAPHEIHSSFLILCDILSPPDYLLVDIPIFSILYKIKILK